MCVRGYKVRLKTKVLLSNQTHFASKNDPVHKHYLTLFTNKSEVYFQIDTKAVIQIIF